MGLIKRAVSVRNANCLNLALQQRLGIPQIIGYIKMNASKEINKRYGETEVWQRSYHDHVIRDIKDYERIYKYICENPIFWEKDCFYTEEI